MLVAYRAPISLPAEVAAQPKISPLRNPWEKNMTFSRLTAAFGGIGSLPRAHSEVPHTAAGICTRVLARDQVNVRRARLIQRPEIIPSVEKTTIPSVEKLARLGF